MEVKLGFGPSPRPRHIYIDQDKSPTTGWYSLDGEMNVVPIEQPAVTGYVKRVETFEQEYKGETNLKLQVHVSCGQRNFIIRSGFYTAFSRCVLASLARMKPEYFETPLAIETRLGDEGKAVFATVYNATNGKRIKYEWPREDSLVDQLYTHVCSLLGQRAAPAPQPDPEPEQQRQAREDRVRVAAATGTDPDDPDYDPDELAARRRSRAPGDDDDSSLPF